MIVNRAAEDREEDDLGPRQETPIILGATNVMSWGIVSEMPSTQRSDNGYYDDGL